MGQKINPNILRLGTNKTWKTKFFEKKRQELPLYTFKDLEIKDYVERFLHMRGIWIHDYKQHYTNSTLNLYVSYFVTHDFSFKRNNMTNVTLVSKNGSKKVITNVLSPGDSKQISESSNLGKVISKSNFYEVRRYLKLNSQDQSQNLSIKLYGIKSKPSHYEGNPNDKAKTIFKELFHVLNSFTNNKFDILINFCCTNKDLSFLKASQTKKFLSLQKYRNAPFLKEGLELLFQVIHNTNSAYLLATFVASQIRKIKRQKFFSSFLKQALTLLINSKLSKAKGVKILIKGRLNGVPRAKHKMIIVGDVPIQSIGAKLDYAQKTIHNSNGSYGIKVWIAEK